MKTKVKEKSLAVLEKDLDAVFSDFIRMRDSSFGYVNCFICGRRVPWKQSENGHYIPRAKMPTRYHEDNCHAICIDCNRYDSLHSLHYETKMIFEYGTAFVVSLNALSQSLSKFIRSDLIQTIEDYKVKVAALRKQKGL